MSARWGGLPLDEPVAAMSGPRLTLPELAAMLRAAMAQGRWKDTELGKAASRYLDSLEYAEAARTTLVAYEYVLGLFVAEHADLALVDLEPPQGGGVVRTFLDRHWRSAAPATRRQRLAILRSFLTWLVGEGLLRANPAVNVRAPKGRGTERNAHPPSEIRALIYAQPSQRDRVCLMLLGWLGLRKNELAELRAGDVDLIAGRIVVQGKGGVVATIPIGYPTLHQALFDHLNGRAPDEYLLHPRSHPTRRMNPATVHRWWTQCLDRARLERFPLHELRHSAAQALYEETGDPVLAQMLLRHADIRTTRGYLHPSLDRLETALQSLDPSSASTPTRLQGNAR
jgi:integrase/recombinase XerC